MFSLSQFLLGFGKTLPVQSSFSGAISTLVKKRRIHLGSSLEFIMDFGFILEGALEVLSYCVGDLWNFMEEVDHRVSP
jgi:hypothetical protein